MVVLSIKKALYLFKNKSIITSLYLQKNYGTHPTYLFYKICLLGINSNLKT